MKSIKLDIPADIAGWRTSVERAKNIYWLKRKDGATENEALLAVLDDCPRDPDHTPTTKLDAGSEQRK